MSVSVNHAGVAHARSLIRSGKVKNSESWSGPSADKENEYLKNHSISEYGKWFLAIDSEVPSDTKGHYKFPYSDNFEDADIKGLKAAKSRAAQQGYTGIEKAADSLIGHNEKKSQGMDSCAEYVSSHYIDSRGNVTLRLKKVDDINWDDPSNHALNW